jgi:Family of unknown function (DUF5681)
MYGDDSDNGDPEKVRGRPFGKGRSGNPRGRPKGARNRMSLALDELAYCKAEPIINQIIDKAVAGDQFAQRLFLERVLPRNRDRPVTLEIPELGSASDAAHLMQSVLEAIAAGDLTLSEAEQVRAVVETYLTAREASEFERRLANIEDAIQTM